MCGIAGIIGGTLDSETRHGAVTRMTRAMAHRGPDDEGFASGPDWMLGMRRLAIFDPAHGRQPMQGADGRHTLVFNGAIYNFRELRAELVALGHAFRTDCDTEVLLQALVRWGTACLPRLRGMYAFAFWDEKERTLVIARDPFGIKPLYYSVHDKTLHFASEIGPLRGTRLLPDEIDAEAVIDYLRWFGIPAPRTLHRNIRSLLPGECLSWSQGVLKRRHLWDLQDLPSHPTCKDPVEFSQGLRRQLEDSIRAHAIADVPVGAFLSGGLDSAIVSSLMARQASGPLRTFSIVFPEKDYSEDKEALETASHLGASHSPYLLTGRQVAEDIGSIIGCMDNPTGDGINTFYVSRAAKAGGVTVALSGLGGDEIFGGYPSFGTVPGLARWTSRLQALPPWMLGTLIRLLARGGTREKKLAEFLTHGKDLDRVASLHRRVLSDIELQTLLSPDLRPLVRNASPLHPRHASIVGSAGGSGLLGTVSAFELHGYMADILLPDSDHMSMRNSLELRVPFVDRPLLSWVWSQREELRFDTKQPKAPLARAVADLLPPGMLARKKRGFTLPFDRWMRKELRPFLDETFSREGLARCPELDPGPVARVWKDFVAGNDPRQWSRVWSLAVLVAVLENRRRA